MTLEATLVEALVPLVVFLLLLDLLLVPLLLFLQRAMPEFYLAFLALLHLALDVQRVLSSPVCKEFYPALCAESSIQPCVQSQLTDLRE